MDESTFTIELELKDGYSFLADFGAAGVPPLLLDEPPPLGEGKGQNAARVLATAVANCLSASALFCLRRSRIDVKSMRTTATVTLVRNERGRLRVGEIRVNIRPEVTDEDVPRMKRCLEIFEDYCIVGESVRGGIPVDVKVETREAVAA